MPILPNFALFVILQSWSMVLHLVSAVWYERQLSRYRHHWLVQLHQIADLSSLEQACTAFHANNGLGAPVIHTVPRLVRALLVKYLYNLSLRQTEEQIDNHILIKWFVGYGLFEPPPDHSTLDRFELWLFRHHPRLFFDEVIRLVDRLCPEDRQRLQIVDTFAMHARAANTYLIELLRDICRHILCRLAEIDPDRHLALLAQLNLLDLFGRPEERITPALNSGQRAERLQRVGQQARRLLRLLNDSLNQTPCLTPDDQAPLRLLLAALDKIITDEITVTANNSDDPDDVILIERKHGKKGHYRIGSATDIKATYRKNHTDAQAILGYNPIGLTTTAFIRDILAATGAEPDNLGLPAVLQSQFDHHGFFPNFLAGDMIFGHGKTRAAVEIVSEGQTQIIALVPDYDQRSVRFNPRDFTLSDDALTLTCPHNQTPSRCYSHKSQGGIQFRFPAKLCRNCPLWNQCRGPDSKKSAMRSVFISFYRDQIEKAQEFNLSDTFKAGIKQRMNVERIIFCLTHIYGARYAHSYGQERTDYQLEPVLSLSKECRPPLSTSVSLSAR
jgi:hypothetical protein